MRGHQQSNMRKLNRHWQSGGEKDWPNFNRYLSFSPGSLSTVPFFTDRMDPAGTEARVQLPDYNVPSVYYKLPADGRVKLECYAKLKRFNNPSIIDVGSPSSPIGLSFQIMWSDNPNIITQSVLADQTNTVNNLTNKSGVYKTNDVSMANPINNFKCLSKDRNNPTIFEYDLATARPSARYFFINTRFYLSVVTASFPNGIIWGSSMPEDRSEIDIFFRCNAEVQHV